MMIYICLHWILCFHLHTVHGFTNASYDVEEGGRLDTEFELNVKGTTNFPNLNLLGRIVTEPGSNTSEFN